MVARTMVNNVLEPMGHEVIQAGNGQEALKILDKLAREVGVVLLDWNMPIMNGFEALQAIRSNRYCDHISILMVSTESEAEYIDRAMKAGANGYLAKPFTKDELIDKINSIVQSSSE
ncbi:MAG: response regulator [Desulfatitalea sp.]|nr:response regulator [Desulfatitalea sp.]